MRASLPVNLPWIRALMIVGKDGRVQCATNNTLVGLDLSDRNLFPERAANPRLSPERLRTARQIQQQPIMMAAYPVSAITDEVDSVIVAGVNLDWMSKIMSNLGGRPGISAVLVDSAGTVMAAPADQASMIGRALDTVPLLSAIADKAVGSEIQPQGRYHSSPPTARNAPSVSAHRRHPIAPDRQHR